MRDKSVSGTRSARSTALHFLVAATSAFSLAANAADEVQWRMTGSNGETSILYQHMTKGPAERITTVSNGAVKVTPFGAGVIAPSFEAIDAVLDGTADAASMPLFYLVNSHPANGIIGGLPGGMGPEALYSWLYNGGGKELLMEFHREEMNLHTIPCGIGPGELFGHSHVPIRTAEDLQGVKFRTVGPMVDILEQNFDASPVVVAGGEVYTMLERKALDMAEWSGPSENAKAGLQETAEYIIYPGPQLNSFLQILSVKADTWDALPSELQVAVESACQISSWESNIGMKLADIEGWKELKRGDNTFIRIDDSLVEAFREAGRNWAKTQVEAVESEGDEWGRKIFESYFRFYDNWLENSEFMSAAG